MSARFERHTGEPSSRLLDATEARMVEHVALIHPTIALGADAIVWRVLGADRCMTEVAVLLESKPARPCIRATENLMWYPSRENVRVEMIGEQGELQ